jgi:hypothetical protein
MCRSPASLHAERLNPRQATRRETLVMKTVKAVAAAVALAAGQASAAQAPALPSTRVRGE